MPYRLVSSDVGWLLSSFEDPSKTTWTLAEQIANRLVEGIVRGTYPPGTRLQEIALARRFEVSRGPIRDALRLLEREGLVTIQPRRGAFVTRLGRDDVVHICAVRAALYEVACADLARARPARITAFLDRASTAVADALASDDLDRFVALVYRLSMYLAEAAGNPYARNVLFSLGRLTLSLTKRVLTDPGQRRLWAANWQSIVDAVRRGDPEAAGEAGRRLVNGVEAGSLAVLDAESRTPARGASGP